MAKSASERMADWRERTTFKANFFDIFMEAREARFAGSGIPSPEHKQVATFCARLPWVERAPAYVSPETGALVIGYDQSVSDTDVAGAVLAARRISSLPVVIEHVADGSSARIDVKDGAYAREMVRLNDGIADMKRLGLWKE